MKILICDRDEEYLQALVTFLINNKDNLKITTYTSEERLEEIICEEDFLSRFSYMILASPFYELVTDIVAESKGREGNPIRIRLSEDQTSDEKAFFKYQPINLLLKRLADVDKTDNAFEARDLYSEKLDSKSQQSEMHEIKKNIALISPIHHELLTPYGLVAARALAERERVLLVDCQQTSILAKFCGHSFSRNLMDYIYMLESNPKNQDAPELSKYIECIEGLEILGAALNPMELVNISKEQWKNVLSILNQSDYDRIIWLFDEVNSGFETIIPDCSEVHMITKQGAYYEMEYEIYEEMFKQRFENVYIKKIFLNLTGMDISCGNFQLEELMNGKLNGIVRKNINPKG